ncbi:DNA polymerase III subunit alpha [Haloferula sp.]|uniref:DNA polymerase III subunit alpha n=1 Tax=Haloferula sp. TaxID=2497595 RepID=UPI0032A10A27
MSFTELNARSAFSFLHGASLPEDIVARAAALDYRSVAITDRLGFQGSARAHTAAQEHKIRAHVGTVLENHHTPEVVALAATRQGYAQLCQHLTTHLREKGHSCPDSSTRREATHSLTSHFSLACPSKPWRSGGTFHSREAGNVIALTGDRDFQLSRLLLQGKNAEAETFTRDLIKRFGHENLYIQLTRHHLRDDPRLNRLLIDLARHLKLPLVASNAPLHATRADRLLCDAFTCLRHHTTLDQAGALLAPNGERHLKSPQQMCELFADLPEAITNAQHLAERLDFTLENLGYEFPDAHDSCDHPLSLAEQTTQLRRHTYHGAFIRYGTITRKIKAQLEHELALIQKLGFQGYFLIVHDIMGFAKAHGIFCQGRGSAANSAVCYALGITNVDPIGGGLLFERFLSENRRSWPDIDIDFPSGERRELVIQHVFEKYGPRGAAMTANVITYRPKSAFREMSKVLGFPPAIADRFSDIRASPKSGEPEKRGCPGPGQAVADAARGSTPSRGAAAHALLKTEHSELANIFHQSGIPSSHPRLPALLHLYQAVLTFPRHLGQHSGGMIICDRGLDHIVPLQPASMPGRTIVQWDKDDCEDLGIVKVDLLGLGMLAAIEDSLKICEQRGHPVDPATIPKDDPAVYDLLCRADTIGTFQVESRAQMATLPIMKPRTFYDLAIEVAIIRPGPIVGDLLHPYLNRRQGIHDVDYIHPSLEPILKRTLGVPLFQEQVLRMAMTLADFDGAEADQLRRAMAFKRADEKMDRISHKLRQRMSEKGIPADAQDKVVKSIGSFALYGFPESHAISFALIAYLSCWMKAHRPAEFYCGLINNQPMGFYSVNTLIEDAKRHHVRTRPISVVHSSYETTIEDHLEPLPQKTLRPSRLGGEKNPEPLSYLRLGLHRLKGLKKATAERIIIERSEQAFESLPDFLRRVQPNDKERRILAASGTLNPLPEVEHRRHALWQSELPLFDDLLSNIEPRTSNSERRNQKESQILSSTPPRRTSKFDIERSKFDILPPMSDSERLAADLALTGSTTGPHPMRLWRQSFLKTENQNQANPHRAQELHALPHGVPVAVCGMVICRQRPSTAKGHCFISLEDETGIANLFVPRDTFHQYKLLITTEPFLLIEGRLQISEGGQPTVYTTQLSALPGINTDHATGSHDFH